jgi:hypothetical protein
MSNQQDLGLAKLHASDALVECLGMTFASEEARRAHFLNLLREKLQDPEFRKTPGFPKANDEAILHMSDPPYYTACPNPFLEDFVRVYGRPYDASEHYEREPFAVDVSVGKTDQLYKAHGYHTKVPHLAIVPSILHYTRPGDLVLDGFCGSGMTGLAAQWCGTAPASYRQRVEAHARAAGQPRPEWGVRKTVLNDLGPAATFIAAGYNLPCDMRQFEREAKRILDEVEKELGWMYVTSNPAAKKGVRLNLAVWSEVFVCEHCGAETVFLDAALDASTGEVDKNVLCSGCGAIATKEKMQLAMENFYDSPRGIVERRPRRVLAWVEYGSGRSRMLKRASASDVEIAEKAASLPLPSELPTTEFPDSQMKRVGRMKTTNVQALHHLFLPRPAHVIAALWRRADAVSDRSLHRMLKFWIDSQLANLSIQNRFRPNVSFPYNPLSGVYYVSSAVAEPDPFKAYANKLKRIVAAFGQRSTLSGPAPAMISTGDCGSVGLPDDCVDYVFTDPPFGENIYYGDLNFQVEAWHGVLTDIGPEAIVDRVREKSVHSYQALMTKCFSEYRRMLKPGRWLTVVFSNASNAIWRAIQEAIGVAGLVVADVRTLDRKQGSFKQVTSSAVKQDLVISTYKPTEALTHRFELGHATAEDAWAFVKEHLGNVPVFVGHASEGEVVAERTAQMLLDRMIAFHVQRGIGVPLSGPEFLQGLAQRFPERDAMYFLPDQVAEYDRKRTSVSELRQLSLFVNDEASAIQWVRQQLQDKPQSFQDLTPQYMREAQAWAKHEETVELKTILEQSFLHYDGRGPVPSQIHRYLSSNYKDLRNLEKDDPRLVEKARDRWYVPDPSKQAEREAVREKSLLREFDEYKTSTQRKLKVFRTEAVRVGFKACWQERDYGTIIKVAEKLPEAVVQEDEKLLMYYDNALTRSAEAEGVHGK